MLKILIADDHPLFREALKASLATQYKKLRCVESDSLQSTLQQLRASRNISLIVLDLHMPGCDNFYGLLRVRECFPNIPVLVLSANDSVETISKVMEFGAKGFVSKTASIQEMKTAFDLIMDGGSYLPEGIAKQLVKLDDNTKDIANLIKGLTPKQFQVLRLLKDGMMNKQIADVLNVTEATVKAHVGGIFKKLNVKTRTQIVLAVEALNIDT